jgi:transposase
MPSGLLYHFLGVYGYQFERILEQQDALVIVIRQPRESYACPCCGSKRVHSQGAVKRRFRTVPVGSNRVFIELAVPRVWCRDCGIVRQVQVPFAEGKRRYTKVFEQYALKLLRIATTQHIADLLGTSWDTIREIERRYLERHFARPSLKKVRRIAIDEIAVRKGHRYLTLVLDLDTGRVVHVAEGRKTTALDEFWQRLKEAKVKLKAVAADMWRPYINAVLKHFPKAALVFDRFHVMKLFSKRLTELRRELFREAKDGLQRKVLQRTRWLLLKNEENLNDEKREVERLEEALALNKPLATAYYLKEELREFWEQPGRMTAEFFLEDWCARAKASRIKLLQSLAKVLRGYRRGLVAWYDHPISTGPLEGVNNKIKTLKRMAYGYRNQEYFKLKILSLHCSSYALIG